jgi:biotin carboxylase
MSIPLKSVMIVSAGEMQIPAIKTAKEMGFFVIASDKNPDSVGFKLADLALAIDTKDVESHVQFAVSNKKKYNIVGAFAAADVAVTVAAVTSALDLPGIPIDVAFASNNKSEMKKRWIRDGVPTPYSVEVLTIEEAKNAIEKIGFPIMIKAVDNAASRGNRKIISYNELPAALEDAKKNSTTGTALVEEFVEGIEYSVETIVYKGNRYHYGIVDRHFGFAPYAIETGHTNPTRISQKEQDAIYGVVDHASKSLGIEFGPAKADMIVTRKGPMILEMPARLSGGWHSQYTTPLAWGIDPIKDVLNISTGGSISKENTIPKYNRVSVCKAIFPEPGKIINISGLKEASRIDGVKKIILTVKTGDIIEEYQNCSQRVCYIITVGDNAIIANRIWDEAASTIRIETE